jgi:hypothetical protein
MEDSVWFDAKTLICQRQKKQILSRAGTLLALDLRFHRAMLFRSGEINPAEGYPRPPEFNGQAIATGTE